MSVKWLPHRINDFSIHLSIYIYIYIYIHIYMFSLKYVQLCMKTVWFPIHIVMDGLLLMMKLQHQTSAPGNVMLIPRSLVLRYIERYTEGHHISPSLNDVYSDSYLIKPQLQRKANLAGVIWYLDILPSRKGRASTWKVKHSRPRFKVKASFLIYRFPL